LNNKILSPLVAASCAGLLFVAVPFASAAAPRWEITLGVEGNHNADGSITALPQAELEYRWRERIHLISKLSWPAIKPAGEPSRSGVGIGEIGVKLLFWDDPDARFSMALCPQMARSVNASSVRRGIVSEQREFALPIETKFTTNGVEFELSAGRTFIKRASDAWTVELKARRPCLPRGDCILTLERSFVPMEPPGMLVQPGVEWKLNNSLTLLTELGREAGPRNADRKDLVISVGLKILY
jgi:hypothetical protein